MKLIANLAPIDRQAIEELGIPGLLLMEAAGRAVAVRVAELLDSLEHAPVAILCGRGNNGGDGFVCARQLAMLGVEDITVFHTSAEDGMKGDALTHFRLLRHYPVEVIHCPQANEETETRILNAAVVVDALFGSGLARAVEGVEAALIRIVNDPAKHDEQCVVSVDIPSGVDGATGQVLGTAVAADFTVTFATPKPGLFLPPGKTLSGRVEVADIGIPRHLIDQDPSPLRLTTRSWVREHLPERAADAHKYSVGSVLILAGSRDMPGAAQLCAEAAMACGAGMVTLAAPESVFSQLKLMPEIVHLPLPETADGHLGPEAIEPVLVALSDKKCRAISLGPGFGTSPETVRFVAGLLERLQSSNLIRVIDADGLNCLGLMENRAGLALDDRVILTPHVGEASRLLKQEAAVIQPDLIRAARSLQEAFSAQVVLKASVMVTARTDGLIRINPTGNPGMATAGSGDVLTGIIASLAAQGLSADQAAALGPFIHGLAGDLAVETVSEHAMRASEITRHLPQAFGIIMEPDDDLYPY